MTAEYDQQFSGIKDSLESVTSGLDRQHDAIAAVLARISANHRALQEGLGGLAEGQEELGERIGKVGKDLAALAEQTRREFQRLSAQVGLVDLRAEIKDKYGPYDDVRRAVRGIVSALDAGTVNDATLQHIAETKTIDVPDYWLAAMLNATVSWVRRDRVTMESALHQAMAGDPGKASLFAGLFNARYRRFEATTGWFQRYLGRQDALELSDDFAVVLDAAVLGVLGPDTLDQINTTCLHWYDVLARRSELVEAQVTRWEKAIARRTPRNAEPLGDFRRRYPVLTRVADDWRETARDLHQAGAFAAADQILQPLDAADTTDLRERLKRIDQVLLNLTRLPEPHEHEMRTRADDLRRMMDLADGDPARPEAAAAEATLKPVTDFLSLITDLAMHPERFGVSVRTTHLAMYLAKDWIEEAVTNLRERSASAMPETLAVRIEGCPVDLGSATTEELTGELVRRLDEDTEVEAVRERRTMQRFGFLAVAVACGAVWLVSILSGVAFGAFQSLILLGLCVGFGVAAGGIHWDTPRRLVATRAKGDARKTAAIRTLHAAVAAHADLVRRWRESLRQADGLREAVHAVPPLELRTAVAPGSELAPGGGQGLAKLPSWSLLPEGW